jgi:hypothetical protein
MPRSLMVTLSVPYNDGQGTFVRDDAYWRSWVPNEPGTYYVAQDANQEIKVTFYNW